MREYVHRTGKSAAEVVIDANAETLTVDVSDLENVVLFPRQVVDAGTVVLEVEISADGTHFATLVADLTEASFGAGANVVGAPIPVEGANGMPMACKQVRLRASALAGGGSYGLVVSGFKRL